MVLFVVIRVDRGGVARDTSWEMPFLQYSRDARVEKGTGRCEDIV